jgi:hypothetical protein
MTADASARAELARLNADYIRSVQTGDVARFDSLLAADFRCSLPDGTLIDRAAFLERTARPVAIRDLRAHDLVIRVLDDLGIVHGKTAYVAADGQPGTGCYTDVWIRRGGEWKAVSAHVTRFR